MQARLSNLFTRVTPTESYIIQAGLGMPLPGQPPTEDTSPAGALRVRLAELGKQLMTQAQGQGGQARAVVSCQQQWALQPLQREMTEGLMAAVMPDEFAGPVAGPSAGGLLMPGPQQVPVGGAGHGFGNGFS